jgi:hypothetical protein
MRPYLPLAQVFSVCMKLHQCCGTGAGTPGTVTFCLSETGFGHGSNIEWNTIVQNKKLETNFLGNNTACSNEKADFFC